MWVRVKCSSQVLGHFSDFSFLRAEFPMLSSHHGWLLLWGASQVNNVYNRNTSVAYKSWDIMWVLSEDGRQTASCNTHLSCPETSLPVQLLEAQCPAVASPNLSPLSLHISRNCWLLFFNFFYCSSFSGLLLPIPVASGSFLFQSLSFFFLFLNLCVNVVSLSTFLPFAYYSRHETKAGKLSSSAKNLRKLKREGGE